MCIAQKGSEESETEDRNSVPTQRQNPLLFLIPAVGQTEAMSDAKRVCISKNDLFAEVGQEKKAAVILGLRSFWSLKMNYVS